MVKVKINDKDLHKVQMGLKSENDWCTSYLSYPKHRIKAETQNLKLILKIPPLLVIELYRSEILSQNKNKSMQIKIDNKDYGLYKVKGLMYPDELHDDGLVEIELTQTKNE
ncbi:MAG: hypothetical protein AABX33_05875 [Nanoarchaeota archaeon]|mgnify:CR=1 FL=1